MRVMKNMGKLVVLGALLAGCGDYSNQTLKEDLEFLTAVPAKTALELRVAESQPRQVRLASNSTGLSSIGQAVLGQVADWYLFTLIITLDVNINVFGFLNTVDFITALPPSRREENQRIWGPWRPLRETPMSEWRFVMTKDEAGELFDMSLQVRDRRLRDDRDADEGWLDCLWGNVTPTRGSLRRGVGDITTAPGVCNQFEDTTEQGTAHVFFDSAPDAANPDGKTSLQIEFVDFISTDMLERNPDALPLNATYRYLERGDLSGDFHFDLWTDLSQGEDPLQLAEEHVELKVVWDTTGAGRADSNWADGDLGALEGQVHECWGAAHRRVYYMDTLGLNPTEGVDTDCALPPATFE